MGYGGSMGGYAAIKYSNLLNMQKIVAFVPQFSIDREVVEDRRYAEFFDASIHQNMQIQADEVDASLGVYHLSMILILLKIKSIS